MRAFEPAPPPPPDSKTPPKPRADQPPPPRPEVRRPKPRCDLPADPPAPGTPKPSAASARLAHFGRWLAWQARFIWQAVMQREFEDERVQRLVRQHFKEFYRVDPGSSSGRTPGFGPGDAGSSLAPGVESGGIKASPEAERGPASDAGLASDSSSAARDRDERRVITIRKSTPEERAEKSPPIVAGGPRCPIPKWVVVYEDPSPGMLPFVCTFGMPNGGATRAEAVFWAERSASNWDFNFVRPEGWENIEARLPRDD